MLLADNDYLTQNDAVSLEWYVGSLLRCGPSGYGGLVNADLYRKHPLEAAIACIVFLHPTGDDDRIDSRIADFFSYWRHATKDEYTERFTDEFKNLIDFVKNVVSQSSC